ncbi:hypothetical protein NKG94_02155 [Micromonospora sp. M12]
MNALAGEFVDASLDLLPAGGRFVEMGKADIRDADVRPGSPIRRSTSSMRVRSVFSRSCGRS